MKPAAARSSLLGSWDFRRPVNSPPEPKTWSRCVRRVTPRCHPLNPTPPATPTPTRLAIQHATQRQPACGTAKPAARIAGPDRELRVAPRPIARTRRKIFGDFRCALALARGRNGRTRGRGGGGPDGPLPKTLAITNVLCSPTLTPRLARTIPLARPPPTPTRRRLRTGFTAIPRLRA